jgi:hypothetical protein
MKVDRTLAKNSNQTAVLAFVTRADQATASKTLALIPKEVPVLRVDIPFEGVVANLSALLNVLHLVGSAGRARRIDPGRPGVPSFGRRLYHMKANEYRNNASEFEKVPIDEAIAIERKSGKSISGLLELNNLLSWREAYPRPPFRVSHPVHTTPQSELHRTEGPLCGPFDLRRADGGQAGAAWLPTSA